MRGAKRLAVILFNLGGPDSFRSVKPFLFNLFSDPAIIQLPMPIRQILAFLIARGRTKEAKKNYAVLGGRTPLLENTLSQAQALEVFLNNGFSGYETKTFVSMRYWHPRAKDVFRRVLDFSPDQVVLLPLYPHFSTTTTASSLQEWRHVARATVLKTVSVCCYPSDPMFVQAWVDNIKRYGALEKKPRLLFSAHGLPQKIVDEGDPYARHIEKTIHAIVKNFEGVDYQICYQSRVGPLRWLQPSLNQALQKAADDQVGVSVVPISFVSEHVETLVELDQAYYRKSKSLKVPFYNRVPTLQTHPLFIEGLANQVKSAVLGGQEISWCGKRKNVCERCFNA